MRANTPRQDALNTVARLIPIFLFAFFAFLLFRSVAGRPGVGGARPRDWRTYRPRNSGRSGAWRKQRDGAQDASPFMVRAAELEGLRDAYSGAPIDATRPLLRCVDCSAIYHSDSARVLDRDNAGRCSSCGGRDFRAVVVQRD
jgi:DNA-directed RNA polymerase subunit RPC12/RpoP